MSEEEQKKKRIPRDSSAHVISLNPVGLTIEHLLESARMEAARIFNVSTKRIAVQIDSVHVASRDPFPTDLSTHAAVDQLTGHARCILKPDPDMPLHDIIDE
jgi:hypothetical protein